MDEHERSYPLSSPGEGGRKKETMSEMAILNVGRGDTKISFDPANPDECKRGARIIRDMLKLGYAIAVKDGDAWKRVRNFDPDRCEYLISDVRAEGRGTGGPKRLAARSHRTVAVARSAGGMSVQHDSVEVQNLRTQDRLSGLRETLAGLSEDLGLWAGIPMPIEGSPLVVEPKYALACAFSSGTPPSEAPMPKIRNRFWTNRYHADCVIWEDAGGALQWDILYNNPALIALETLGNSAAWSIEQEASAVRLLADLLSSAQFKSYLLTGQFIETSKRSGVVYIFRKLRPTLALRASDTDSRILAALCMHPIAYYEGSWAGAMCPTDDVVAHLTLMRADEPMYWRRCNQHAAYRPEAGL